MSNHLPVPTTASKHLVVRPIMQPRAALAQVEPWPPRQTSSPTEPVRSPYAPGR